MAYGELDGHVINDVTCRLRAGGVACAWRRFRSLTGFFLIEIIFLHRLAGCDMI